MRYDYAEILAMQHRARHERAEAVYRLLIAPFLELLARSRRKAPAPRKFASQG